MLKEFLIVLIIMAIAVALLGLRLLLGRKNALHTHIDGNPEMERRGIHCAVRQDLEERINGGLAVAEHEKT